jgi:subtilisin family serine protease
MACAGLIAASHTLDSIAGLQTSTGIISMKPQVKILPVRIFKNNDAGLTPEKNAAAIAYARISGASILSNSWGYGPATPLQGFDVINRAINDAYVVGRGGFGCVILFAAGNDSIDFVTYPANRTNVLAVGAITTSDQRWAYSNYGTELDVVAPSGDLCLQGGLWSLDQMASSGYNPNVTYCDDDVTWNCSAQNDVDYDCHFGGTSGACPIVAGAAALILAKQPNLLANEVFNILRQSSDTTLAWGTVPRFSSEYGYGCVDAFAGVLSLSHGDLNQNGSIDLTDLNLMIAYLTVTPKPTIFPSKALADWNCSDNIDLTDLTSIISYMLYGGAGPVKPCFKFSLQ